MKQKGKSSIVLLITLFFIFSISILILKNLQDHEQFINESELDSTLIQIQISSSNIQKEIISLINKYSDNIDDIIEITSNGIPFDYGNINLHIVLDYYNNSSQQCNINTINFSIPLMEQCDQDIVENISYPYDFLELLRDYKVKYKEFKSKDQVDYFIDEYKYQTRDENIDKIKDDFVFLKLDENNTYLQCNYEMLINSNTINGVFVFDNNQTKKLFNLTIN
jgi:hypothetical protein